MDKKNTNLNSELNKLGLIKVFSSLDTQSAIVAAFVISLSTVVSTGFVNLCNYMYWSAYFSRFNIPLAYLEEAIIPESETKYMLIIFAPIVIFVWWMLGEIFDFTKQIINKLKLNNNLWGNNRHSFDYRFSKLNTVLKIILGFFVVAISFMFFLALWAFLVEKTALDSKGAGTDIIYTGLNIVYLEIALYSMLKISKVYFGKYFSLPPKGYIFIRVLGILLVLYTILAGVYMAGSFDNYSNGEQQVKIINNYALDYGNLKDGMKYDVNIVLLETVDYYYVTDATMEIRGNGYHFSIWDDDTYKFIDKKENSIKTIYGELWKPGRNNSLNYNVDGHFFGALVLMLIYIFFVSIPVKAKDPKESKRLW